MNAPGAGELLALAADAAAAAGRLLADQGAQARPEVVETKSSLTDVVTEMDRRAEALITKRIRAARPGDAILGEEGGETHGAPGPQEARDPSSPAAVRWIVDPLDGTVNYLYGQADWAVSIAAEVAGTIVAGVVAVPLHGETFLAVRGQGAWLHSTAERGSATEVPAAAGLSGTGGPPGAGCLPATAGSPGTGALAAAGGPPATAGSPGAGGPPGAGGLPGAGRPAGALQLRCTREVPLGQALVGTGFGYLPGRRRVQGEVVAALLPQIRDIRRGGSASVDLCMVAAGRLDAFYERGLNYWDYAAGALIAAEAGARVTGLAGRPVSTSMTVAAGPGLYEELTAVLAALNPERDT